MKKLLLISIATFVFLLSGCAGNMKNMMMMEEQMAEMQRQLNTAEASAATAKDMAAEALTKSSRNHSKMRKMFGRKMMK